MKSFKRGDSIQIQEIEVDLQGKTTPEIVPAVSDVDENRMKSNNR